MARTIARQRDAAGVALTDDQAQLIYERQRLAIVEAKQAQAVTAIDRWYYATCAAGWRRSIETLERRINENL